MNEHVEPAEALVEGSPHRSQRLVAGDVALKRLPPPSEAASFSTSSRTRSPWYVGGDEYSVLVELVRDASRDRPAIRHPGHERAFTFQYLHVAIFLSSYSGMFPCLRRGRDAFGRSISSAPEIGARLASFDHVVDVAALRGDERVGKTFGVFGDQLVRLRACGSAASAISRRKIVLTAPSGPMTAISAVGHARLTSARMCLDAMTS